MKPYQQHYIKVGKQANEQEKPTPNKHGSYGGLLLDKRWKDKRNHILTRDSNKCVICGLNDNLQVHHRQYHYAKEQEAFIVPWDYPDKLLITLCSACHQRGHSKFKVPIINI